MRVHPLLPLLLAIDLLILIIEASFLSLSYSEAHTYFGYHGISGYLSHIFTPLFGENDIAVRLPMILLHLGSVILLYLLSTHYLKSERERILLVLIYILLPGVSSAALLLNDSGFVIFALFLFVYTYIKWKEHIATYILLGILSLLGHAFFYLFLGLFFYALYVKNIRFALLNILFLLVNLFLYGTDIQGAPTGHFLDLLGVYAAIFSPLVFIYLVYVLYRRFLTKKMDITWFLGTTAFLFSMLLSLRQRVHAEIYAPYLLLTLPLAAQTFINSYKVRLPRFRTRYKLLFNIALFFLALNFAIVLFNPVLYLFLDNPKKHFAYNNAVAKELAEKLHDLNISCVKAGDYKLQLRLRFYDIDQCNNYALLPYSTKNAKNVTIRYMQKPIFQTYVTKLNNK